MHMADALLSPAVGGTLWVVAAGTVAYCARKARGELSDGKVPLMGVLGAFVFAAQMINFAIPATGSSGHLAGGMILAILLGPHAAFLTMASVLTVQALFFADGGLLALGCNIVDMAFFPAFIAYPFFYEKIVGERADRRRVAFGCFVSAIVASQLGAFAIVLETVASGISELPFRTFVSLMQPIHLGIGTVEGWVTAAVVSFVWQALPEIRESAATRQPLGVPALRNALLGLTVAAALVGGGLSWLTSTKPDGLEWSIAKITGRETLPQKAEGLHVALARLQAMTSFLPEYEFRTAAPTSRSASEGEKTPASSTAGAAASASGLIGGGITLAVAALIGLVLRRQAKQA